ncbi:acyl-CoA dehydrogenase family protein [Paraburkholderia sp. LEh10]|uniref:acyl-CoA dehydrogenase family protein n=1 Tax=Paraburkholderia sp. LEh10 TaxID=2821353 RepID=UPI001AE62163|nr:acyl-CoA dehydrogenase family protein [Paraburkholderia sp. LEh10]MBP0591515.1 acyl-CoA dehydrogenase family protein [Paraburkholderia sp. LEh10]
MNFNLNAEQQLLQDSVRRFVDKEYGFDTRTALIKARSTSSAQHWQTFAENGWLAAALPESCGGLGGTLIDSVLIAHEFGRALVVEPWLGCAVLAAQTLLAAGSPSQRERWLPQLADGSRKFALAYSEAQSRGFPEPVDLRAQVTSNGYALSGTKTLVIGGANADSFIVSALTPDADGITLFLVHADAPGLSRRVLPLHDGSFAAELTFERVPVTREAMLGEPGEGLAALRHGLAQATAALCAELVGGMEKAIELTADYLKVRKQFGVPIGSFQALQHRIADMAAEMEVARSMLYALLASIENDDEAARQHCVSQAKSLIGRAARFVCAQAIQLHGGMGMTEECQVGHYYKRAVVAEVLFGTSDAHDAACAAHLQKELLQKENHA